MNISQPVASYIGSVDFGFLSSKDIKTLSVKNIRNPTTFDSLLQPNPGGLHDSALGAWADNTCSTCHLQSYSCPGHAGHIELPVKLYHITFIGQLLRLLRAQCAFCGYLKLPPAEINLYACKLRLIQHGLLADAEELENISSQRKTSNTQSGNNLDLDVDSDDLEDDIERIIHRRNTFVKHAIKGASNDISTIRYDHQKSEAVAEARREIVGTFLASAPTQRACARCRGASYGYRKDQDNKIFRKPLSRTIRAQMAQMGLKLINPLVRAFKERKATRKREREEREIDEGIVADLEDVTSEDSDENAEKLEVEQHMVSADVAASESTSTFKKSGRREDEDVYVNAQEVYASITELFEKEKEILDLVYNSRASMHSNPITADLFFIKYILVPPNKFRPESRTSDGEITEAPQNTLYKQILIACELIEQIKGELDGSVTELTGRRRDFRDFQAAWMRLQSAVNVLIQGSSSSSYSPGFRNDIDGIKQKLEKKEGLFRMHMMGKRVNFAARSVISPDPNLETNEIGVPLVFAKKLTYPEPVTNHNFYELKEAILNGVEKWPGAAAIENENGQIVNLRFKNFGERQALANQLLAPSNIGVNGARNKKVHRHLTDGDIVLMNRQPTLHKPSMMAHRARVLPGEKTIRMHYTNCNAYNADFDGDEMNLHFPQNEIARAETLQIADTDHQYLSATSGKPLRGLIQDHISIGVWLTNRETFFTREDYYQLLYSSLRPENNHTVSDRIQTITPAIIRPKLLWTGKQVVTTILKNITPDTHPGLNFRGISQVTSDRWGDGSEEDIVIMQAGELVCGILDKAHLGPTGGGFVHAVYEAYGHTVAGRLLSVLGRLLTKMLHIRGFSCGMDDLLLTKESDSIRESKLRNTKTIGLEVAAKYVTLDDDLGKDHEKLTLRLQEVVRDVEKHKGLDAVYNAQTAKLSSEITSVCLPLGLKKPFPHNQMQIMTSSGAKGSPVNANLISCNLGQQVLEGRRVPVMISGKTLPSFKPFESDIRAGGYITDRFLTGVKPQEYYFHAMAGREGLIDTAVKTASSGYLQRCLIKGMEGLKVEYDTSVRIQDGTMVQFLYGEDGLDITRQKYLKDFKFLAENYLSLVAQLNIREEFSKLPDLGASKYRKKVMKRIKKTGSRDTMDPVLAVFNPSSNMGSTSENFTTALDNYCDENPDNLLKKKGKASESSLLSKKTFGALVDIKYMKSVVDPGEAVGIVAGQSVGEPSTQMTLNTFHLAGHSARNVTMGIPRLREIVMTASKKPSTPDMTLFLISELSEAAGQKFAKGITKVTLAEVVDKISIKEKLGQGVSGQQSKIFDIQINLFPSAQYEETYFINASDVLKAIISKFIPQVATAMKKEFKRHGDKALRYDVDQLDVGKPSGLIEEIQSYPRANREAGDDEDEEDDEDDATTRKQKRNRDEETSYEAPGEEEESIITEVERTLNLNKNMEDDEESTNLVDHEHMSDSENEGTDTKVLGFLANERESIVKEKNPNVTQFSFDDKEGQWCKIRLEYGIATPKVLFLPLIEAACRVTSIQAIPGLETCIYTKLKPFPPRSSSETTVPAVVTQGVNLRAMHAYQHIINPNTILTNDIHAMLRLYGVEAARATIIREMTSVFQAHSISVDNRHLNLIADVMTRGGGYTAFNRVGMRGTTSPFMKMSFETSMEFLKDAVLDGDWDDLQGPSARLVVGKVGKVGTGVFDVLMPVR